MRRAEPRPLAVALDALQGRLEPDTTLASAQRAWPGVVGAVVAAEARPVAERAGILTVACRASVWAQEIDLLAPTLVGQLNEALGAPAVRGLRCVATRRAEGP